MVALTGLRAVALSSPVFRFRSNPGKVAAAELEAKTVAFAEHIAGGPNIDPQFISLSRVQEFGLFLRIAIAGANNAFGEVLRETVRRNVDELGGEVAVHGGRARVKIELNRARDLEILSEGRSGIDKNIVAPLDGTLVARSGL